MWEKEIYEITAEIERKLGKKYNRDSFSFSEVILQKRKVSWGVSYEFKLIFLHTLLNNTNMF